MAVKWSIDKNHSFKFYNCSKQWFSSQRLPSKKVNCQVKSWWVLQRKQGLKNFASGTVSVCEEDGILFLVKLTLSVNRNAQTKFRHHLINCFNWNKSHLLSILVTNIVIILKVICQTIHSIWPKIFLRGPLMDSKFKLTNKQWFTLKRKSVYPDFSWSGFNLNQCA